MRGAPKNNTNARRDKAEAMSVNLNFRCKPSDKAKWKKASRVKRVGLTEWTTVTLNKESDKTLRNPLRVNGESGKA